MTGGDVGKVLQRSGMTTRRIHGSAFERFWPKVDMSGDCWLWTASLGTTGYGQFMDDYVPRKAHRVAYELAVGPIPPGLTIDHLCMNRICVRPSHLEAVTNAENVSRAHRAGAMSHSGAKQRERTHCPNGHPYEGANLRVTVSKTGQRRRHCRTCENTRRRRNAPIRKEQAA